MRFRLAPRSMTLNDLKLLRQGNVTQAVRLRAFWKEFRWRGSRSSVGLN